MICIRVVRIELFLCYRFLPTENFEKAFFDYVKESLIIKDKYHSPLKLIEVIKSKDKGHSHETNYTFTFEKRDFYFITNQLMFNVSKKQNNHHYLFQGDYKIKFNTDKENPTLIDPRPVLDKVISENIAPIELVLEMFKSIVDSQKLSNTIFPVEQILWDGGIDLNDLFDKESLPKISDEFIEQKFINYLEGNPDKLEKMHWRNFERLTAEFFKRQGYEVELGPGVNDGGIDVRVFDKKDKSKPYIIIQCKRHKESNQVKIETVKSFYTDVEFEGAKKGLIATTSKVSVGGKKVVSIRKYPLQFAENEEIKNWVEKMKHR